MNRCYFPREGSEVKKNVYACVSVTLWFAASRMRGVAERIPDKGDGSRPWEEWSLTRKHPGYMPTRSPCNPFSQARVRLSRGRDGTSLQKIRVKTLPKPELRIGTRQKKKTASASVQDLRNKFKRVLASYRENLVVFHKFKVCTAEVQTMTSLDQLPEMLNTLRSRLDVQSVFLVLSRERYAEFLPDSIDTQPSAHLGRLLQGLGLDNASRQPLLGRLSDVICRFPEVKELIPAEMYEKPIGSLCVFPLWDKYDPEILIGFLVLTDQSAHRYNEEMATDYIGFFVYLFSGVLVTLREHEKLLRESTLDPLTGCHNRNYLMKHAPRILEFSQRRRFSVALLFIDLDGFKQINDTLGHDCGDSLLIAVARLVQGIVRDYDIFIRLGGDEFLLLLPDVDQNTAKRTASRINEGIQSLNVANICGNSTHLRSSASIGVTMHLPGESLQAFIQRADKSMYAVKRSAADMSTTVGPSVLDLSI